MIISSKRKINDKKFMLFEHKKFDTVPM